MKKEYTQAVLEMIQQEVAVDTVLSGLSRTMQSRGHMKLFAPVLSSVLRTLESQQVQNAPVVTVAKEKDLVTYKTAIADTLASLSTKEEPATHIDNTLIGGFVIEHDSVLIDQSHKGKLISLYRRVAK